MSCDYYLWCETCRVRDQGYEWNHGARHLRNLLGDENIMRGLALLANAVENDFVSLRWWQGRQDGPGPSPRFIATHIGHNILIVDEYGQVDGFCPQRVNCSGCGTSMPCALPDKHDGPCRAGEYRS